MLDSYTVGEVAVISLRATDLAGAAVDPGSITLKIRPPLGAVVAHAYGATATVVRDGTGRYSAQIALTAAGTWAYRWELTTPNAGAADGVIHVQKSRFVS